MKDERVQTGNPVSEEATARRHFLKKSGRVAIAAPAVVLLLSAAGKSSIANAQVYGPPTEPR